MTSYIRLSIGSAMTSANPVRNYKHSRVLVNDTSGPSQADFVSAHTNLPFFVNYIWFIILKINYNYISKLQLVMIDCMSCDQLYDLQYFPINYNCSFSHGWKLGLWAITCTDNYYRILEQCQPMYYSGSPRSLLLATTLMCAGSPASPMTCHPLICVTVPL